MNYKNLSNLQPKLIEDFVHILQGSHLAHAYLFSGDFGNFEMALFLAKAIFCTEKTDSLPCEMCRTCRLIESQEFSDVTILSPQGNTIKTDAVREIVKNFSQSGFESSKQVFIIKDAEKMHVNAANSLLKVIEEPQSEIYIFLLTNQLEAVLPTIKSRTQIVQFPKNLALLERSLEESGLLKTQASLLARLVSSQDEAQKLAKTSPFWRLWSRRESSLTSCRSSPIWLIYRREPWWGLCLKKWSRVNCWIYWLSFWRRIWTKRMRVIGWIHCWRWRKCGSLMLVCKIV